MPAPWISTAPLPYRSSTGTNSRKRSKISNRFSSPVANWRHPLGTSGYEVHDDDERKPNAKCANQLPAANGLAIVRLTIGAMLVWVFFENLGKGLYTPNGYAGLINYYIQHDHAPAAWK